MSGRSRVALSSHHDGQSAGDRPNGRRVAGLGLLRAVVEHANGEEIWGYGHPAAKADFENAIRMFRQDAVARWISHEEAAQLADLGTLHLGGPIGSTPAFHRRYFGQRAWSITGVTHTVSTQLAMESIASMVVAPVHAWDALICTSVAVKEAVIHALEEQERYLRDRLGPSVHAPRPQLPVIPLGVHLRDFETNEVERHAARTALGISQDEVAVLFAGRLSFHSKAHPFPLYRALRQAADSTRKQARLILAGWFHDPHQQRVFLEGARDLCPDLPLCIVDGTSEDAWRNGWRAADIFTLLSDNIQESFGLSPIEAMAAGLPVVASDWDGIRDTVVHRETGILIPTAFPPPGCGTPLAMGYGLGALSYDQYIGGTAQMVAVDGAAAADAFAGLLLRRDLRLQMGAAGKARVRALFDWSAVVARYKELWCELAEIRRASDEPPTHHSRGTNNPLWADPFALFSSYPSAPMKIGHVVRPIPELRRATRSLLALPGHLAVPALVCSASELDLLISELELHAEITAAFLADRLSSIPRARTFRTLLWLYKHGLIRILAA